MADSQQKLIVVTELEVKNVAAKLKKLEQQIKRLQDRVNKFDKQGASKFNKIDKSLRKMNQTVGAVFKGFTRLFTMFAKFSFIAMAGEVAIFAAGLLAVKLAMMTGRGAASLYNIALKGLSVTAAGLATALATAAAAMRQFQEAQLSPFLGGGLLGQTQVARMSRGFGATTSGLLGMEGSSQVAGALARAGFRGSTAIGLAQNLGTMTNFDPKAMMQIIQSLGAASAGTGSTGAALGAVRNAVGFNKGANVSFGSLSGLVGAINSGSLTAGSFQGQGDFLSRSMIGTFKTSFAGIRDMFADIGIDLLEPMRQAFLGIAQSLRENFIALQGIIQKFGADSMGPTMVTIFDRMMRFITENIIDHLGNIKEMGENFVGFFRSVRSFFIGMGDFLRQYEPAANVIIDMFRAASGANPSALFRDFSRGLVDNADQIRDFGSGLGRFFGGIFDLFRGGNEGLFGGGFAKFTKMTDTLVQEVFPALRDFFKATTPVIDRIPNILEMIADGIRIVTPLITALMAMMGTVIDMLGALGPIGAMAVTGGVMSKFGRGRGLRFAGAARGSFVTNMLNKAGITGATGIGSGYLGMRVGGYGLSMMSSTNAAVRGVGTGLASLASNPATKGLGLAGKLLPGLGIIVAGQSMFGRSKDTFERGGTSGGKMMGAAIDGALVGLSLTNMFPGAQVAAPLAMAIGGMGGLAVEGVAGLAGFMHKNVLNNLPFGMSDTFGKIPGIGGLFTGRDKKKKAADEAFRNLMTTDFMSKGVSLLSPSGSTVESFSARYATNQEIQSRFQSAMEANLRTGKGGDTEEFNAFLRFLDIDPGDVHRDDLFDALMTGKGYEKDGLVFDENFMQKTGDAQKGLERKAYTTQIKILTDVNKALGKFDMGLKITGQGLNSFVQDTLGLEYMDITGPQSINAGLMATAHALNFSRNRAIIPDLATSGLAKNEKQMSASAALNALISNPMAATSADFTDFFTKMASFEVATGVSPDVAGISGIMELENHLKSGRFGPEGSAGYKRVQEIIASGRENFFMQLSQNAKVRPDTLKAIFDVRGMSGMSDYLGDLQSIRGAISGTTRMGFKERLGILSKKGFTFTEDSFDAFNEATGGAFGGIGFGSGGQSLNQRILGQLNEGNIDEDTMRNALNEAFLMQDLGVDELVEIRDAIYDLPKNLGPVLHALIPGYNDGSAGEVIGQEHDSVFNRFKPTPARSGPKRVGGTVANRG